MFKKITAGVATLALSVGIVSTASAAELIQPSSPIQEPTQVNDSNIITPYSAAQIYATASIRVEKGGNIPDSYVVTKMYNGSKYGGAIPIQKVESFNTYYWTVTYAGYIPKFME